MKTELLRTRDWAIRRVERHWQIRGLRRDVTELLVGQKTKWAEGESLSLQRDEVTPQDLPHLASSFPEFFRIKDMQVIFTPIYAGFLPTVSEHARKLMQDPNSENELRLIFSTRHGFASSRLFWKTGSRITEVEDELTRLQIVKEVAEALRRRDLKLISQKPPD